MIEDLKAAGSRCFQYMIQHGVILEWRIGDGSLVLTGSYGADKVERHLFYTDVKEDELRNAMKQTEEHVLRGLSS
jgi:hypothetical protein